MKSRRSSWSTELTVGGHKIKAYRNPLVRKYMIDVDGVRRFSVRSYWEAQEKIKVLRREIRK